MPKGLSEYKIKNKCMKVTICEEVMKRNFGQKNVEEKYN